MVAGERRELRGEARGSAEACLKEGVDVTCSWESRDCSDDDSDEASQSLVCLLACFALLGVRADVAREIELEAGVCGSSCLYQEL